MNQKKNVTETYQEGHIASSFDQGRKEYSYQKYKHKIESDFLKKGLASFTKKSDFKILDVACGTGRMLKTVATSSPHAKYTGLDTSKKMTQILKDKSKKLNFKIDLKIGDATKLPFKDNSFDVVFTYHLTWHLPQDLQKEIIKELLRVTKKDGYIIFDFLNKNFLWEKIKRLIGKKPTEGIYKISVSEVKKLFLNNQIVIEKLSDFPIKNSSLYSIANLINIFRRILPLSFFHMIYFKVKK
jgi:ubiquinone/menaquinone biosynthesis C-methylase UbiE